MLLRVRQVLQVAAVAVTAVTLASCAQSPTYNQRSASVAANRQAALAPVTRTVHAVPRRPTVVAKKHTPFPIDRPPNARADASHGLASFYREGGQTASGEQFNAGELTAAHRTLPFGTRLRVTNVDTGQSVTVRVNDRGPFVPGRVVDVSSAAAESLAMVGRGVAKVKHDVIE